MLDQLSGGALFPSGGNTEDAGRIAVRLVEQAARTQQLQDQQATENKPAQSEKPKVEPRTEKTVQQVRGAWLQKAMVDWVNKVEAELLELLLNWEPGSGTLEENLSQLQRLMEQYQQQLQAQGQPLMMNGALEDALLQALSRLLAGQAGDFLYLIGPTATQAEWERLLNGLFTRVTGERASREGLANGTALLRQFAVRDPSQNGNGAARQGFDTLGRTAFRSGQPSEGGVIYRQATAGVRFDQAYGGPGRTPDRTPYPIRQIGQSTPLSEPLISGQAIQLAERFARFLQTVEPVPRGELPFTSEERLGLELGIISLYGELTASRPELVPPLSGMIRSASLHYVQEYLIQAGRELGDYAVHHPPVTACPAYRMDAVMQIYQYLLSIYQKTHDPEKAVSRALKHTFAQFQEKKEDITYQSWLRYCVGRNFFAVLHEDELRANLKRGWAQLCKRWNQFLHTMDFPNARFRESVWALVLQPEHGALPAARASLPLVWRWLLVGAGVAIALAGVLPGLDVMARAACLAIGSLVILTAFLKR